MAVTNYTTPSNQIKILIRSDSFILIKMFIVQYSMCNSILLTSYSASNRMKSVHINISCGIETGLLRNCVSRPAAPHTVHLLLLGCGFLGHKDRYKQERDRQYCTLSAWKYYLLSVLKYCIVSV